VGGLSTGEGKRIQTNRRGAGLKIPAPDKCPLCGAESSDQHLITTHVFGGEGRAAAFFHCHSCDVRHQFPRLTPQEEKKFYADEFEAFMEKRAGPGGGWQSAEAHVRANEPNRLRRMEYLRPLLFPGSRVLEVGCSTGFMLYPLVAEGHDCVGVEPSGKISDFLKQKRIRFFSSVEELIRTNAGSTFDLVMHFFVLEHITEPKTFLQQQLELLRPGGTMVFEIPNVADPLLVVYGIPAFDCFYWSIAHPWYFSEKSLDHLLASLGVPYEIRRDQRYDLSNHMVWARDGRPGGMGRFSHFWGDELDRHYKQALIRGGTCDTLIGILRKPK
jgi:SAM-dependent methyltransferase